MNGTLLVSLEQFGQGSDVRLRHLQRFEFGEFAIAAQRRDHFPQSFEGVVEAVHAPSLPRVGRQSPLLHHVDRRQLGTTAAARITLSNKKIKININIALLQHLQKNS